MNFSAPVSSNSGNSYQFDQGHGLSNSGATLETVQEAELRVHETQEAAREAGVKLFPSQRELARLHFRDNDTETKAIKAAEQEVHRTQTAAREAGVKLFPSQREVTLPGFTGQFKFGQD